MMRVTLFRLLKIASDCDFNLLFEKLLAFSKLPSAKFDPCNDNLLVPGHV